MKVFITTLLLSTILLGCSARIADFSVISSRNFDIAADYELVARDVKGSDMVTTILTYKFGGSNLEEAVEEALRKAEGDYMTNAVIYEKSYTILGLFGRTGYVVRGDVWRRK